MNVKPVINPVVPCSYENSPEPENILVTTGTTYRLNDNVVLVISEDEGLVMPPHGNKGNANDPLSIDRDMQNILCRQVFQIPEISEKSLNLLLNSGTIILYDGRFPSRTKLFYSEKFSARHYVLLEITRKCQCNCDICYQRQKPIETFVDPPIETLKKRLMKIKEFGIFWVEILGGEPLLRPDLPQILDFAQELGLEITLSTNGEYLNKDILPHLKGIRKTRISIDAFGKIHDKTRNRDGLFDKAISALDLLYNNGYPVIVTATVSNKNISGLEELLDFLTNKYPQLLIGVRKAKVKPEKGFEHVDLYEIKQKFINKPNVSFEGLERKSLNKFEDARFYGCRPAACFISIGTEGDITHPCYMDEEETTIERKFDDYNSKTALFNDLKKSALKNIGQLSHCKNCSFTDICVGPCRFSIKFKKMRNEK
jgi:radical SAM protein with 4Fe4S-binding SPASM domain